MTESSELNCKNWPELNNEEIIHFYNEIKLKKVGNFKESHEITKFYVSYIWKKLDLDWNNPGRVDTEVIELANNAQKMETSELDTQNTEEKPMEESLTEANTSELEKKLIFYYQSFGLLIFFKKIQLK